MPYNTIKLTDKKVFDRFKIKSYGMSYNGTKNVFHRAKFPAVPENSVSRDEITISEKKSFKAALSVAAFAGALIPLAILNRKVLKDLPNVFKNGTFLEKIKGISNLFNIKNEQGNAVKGMLASGLGAITTGFTIGYVADKDKANRKAKVKELVHETSNLIIPTVLVAGLQVLMAKGGKMHGKIGTFCENKVANKIFPALAGLGTGVPLAFKTTSEINKKIDNDKNTKTKFHFKDFFVHLDDLLGMIVLSDVPYLDTIVDKVLPFIYARCGYEAGDGHVKSKEYIERHGLDENQTASV